MKNILEILELGKNVTVSKSENGNKFIVESRASDLFAEINGDEIRYFTSDAYGNPIEIHTDELSVLVDFCKMVTKEDCDV